MKYPLRILEDVPIKVGDFCVMNDFFTPDMAEGRRCLYQNYYREAFLSHFRLKDRREKG